MLSDIIKRSYVVQKQSIVYLYLDLSITFRVTAENQKIQTILLRTINSVF